MASTEGGAVQCDKSSRPACSPRAIAPATALAIVELRRQLFLQARIAAYIVGPEIFNSPLAAASLTARLRCH